MLRSRSFPKTMRRPTTVPLVAIDNDPTACCDGILTAMPVELPLWQPIPFGTTAWRLSLGRRQVVESANAALKGAFADLSRGFVRVFGRTKVTVLLGFTIAGYNIDRVRSFRAKHRAQGRTDDPSDQAAVRDLERTPHRRRRHLRDTAHATRLTEPVPRICTDSQAESASSRSGPHGEQDLRHHGPQRQWP